MMGINGVLLILVVISCVMNVESMRRVRKERCPDGTPFTKTNCGRGGKPCGPGYFCHIHPADRYAVCCPDKKQTTTERCPDGTPFTKTNCGRGGKPCGPGYFCHIHPADKYAVCCPKYKL